MEGVTAFGGGRLDGSDREEGGCGSALARVGPAREALPGTLRRTGAFGANFLSDLLTTELKVDIVVDR